MKAVGRLITGAIADINVSVDLLISDGSLVADRVSGARVLHATEEPISWVENHIYRVNAGRTSELWSAGGHDLP